MGAGVGTGDSYGGYRTRMVEQLQARGIKDLSVLRAISEVPRHLFVPAAVRHRAYEDSALPLGAGQTISQPWVQARSLELLRLTPRRLLRLSGVVDAAQDEAAPRRATIAQVLDAGVPGTGLLALAPLFERHDPSAMAAAPRPAEAPAVAAAPAAPNATARMFVSVGRQDGTTAADLVAVLTKEVRIDKSKTGRIELKEAYCLVELPAAEVEQIVPGMDGRTVRNKKIMAKVDRGPVTAPPKRRAPTSGGSRAP